jgi:hypothetical protein
MPSSVVGQREDLLVLVPLICYRCIGSQQPWSFPASDGAVLSTEWTDKIMTVLDREISTVSELWTSCLQGAVLADSGAAEPIYSPGRLRIFED